jgi:hypothetical protein
MNGVVVKKTVVGVAQLVEPWIVIPAVAGSSPVIHPKLNDTAFPARWKRSGGIYVEEALKLRRRITGKVVEKVQGR